jgi:hypothetical protein
MVTEIKRKRGRPPGSGGHDDAPYLAQIADLMATNPSMKRSTAMNLVKNTRSDWGASDKTLLQRWRGKLAKQEAGLTYDARERAASAANAYLHRLLEGFDCMALREREKEQRRGMQALCELDRVMHGCQSLRVLGVQS